MRDIKTRTNKYRKLLICIYTNKDRNEFAIGLKEDEMRIQSHDKANRILQRFVDVFDVEMKVVDEKEVDLNFD